MTRFFLAAVLCAAPAGAQAPGAAAAAPAARAITLEEAYALALKRSELIAQDAEAYRQALARVDELRSAVLPRLSALGSMTWQEAPGGAVSSINLSRVPEGQLQVSQPVFSGFREFLAFKAGRETAEAARLTERRARSLLYQDVARAYFTLLAAREEIVVRLSIGAAIQGQIDQISRWVAIGRSRESEALAARSRLAENDAQVEAARAAEGADQEALRFLTGLDGDLAPVELPLPILPPLGGLLARADARDDVTAAGRTEAAFALASKMARRQRWPTILFTGDYYLYRVGFYGSTRWDAALTASLPLFDGGQVSAQEREADAQLRAGAEAVSLARRGAERDVRAAWRGLERFLTASAAVEKAAALAEDNFRAQREDYRRSLVTNLDVLDALSGWESARLALDAEREQAAEAGARLEAAAGGPGS